MTAREFNLSGVRLMIGIPSGPNIPVQTVRSITDTVIDLTARGIPLDFRLVVGCSIVEQARSKVANVFLASDMNRLLMIDSDMAWDPNDVVRLLCLSTQLDVVCATYPAKRDVPTFMLGEQDFSAMALNDYGCFEVNGMGLGFTMVRREVMQRLADAAPKLVFPDSPDPQPHIFRCGGCNGAFQGEDMAFFADVRELGYTVNLDPTIQLGHVGQKEYTGNFLDAIRRV